MEISTEENRMNLKREKNLVRKKQEPRSKQKRSFNQECTCDNPPNTNSRRPAAAIAALARAHGASADSPPGHTLSIACVAAVSRIALELCVICKANYRQVFTTPSDIGGSGGRGKGDPTTQRNSGMGCGC